MCAVSQDSGIVGVSLHVFFPCLLFCCYLDNTLFGFSPLGFNCDQCAVGFYGNATVGTESDCTQCPCSPPKANDTTCSLVNGVVTCTNCAPGHLDALCNR